MAVHQRPESRKNVFKLNVTGKSMSNPHAYKRYTWVASNSMPSTISSRIIFLRKNRIVQCSFTNYRIKRLFFSEGHLNNKFNSYKIHGYNSIILNVSILSKVYNRG